MEGQIKQFEVQYATTLRNSTEVLLDYITLHYIALAWWKKVISILHR